MSARLFFRLLRGLQWVIGGPEPACTHVGENRKTASPGLLTLANPAMNRGANETCVVCFQRRVLRSFQCVEFDVVRIGVKKDSAEPQGLSVFYSLVQSGSEAFRAYQLQSEESFQKVQTCYDLRSVEQLFLGAQIAPAPHLWAIAVERWGLSKGYVSVDESPLYVERNEICASTGESWSIGGTDSEVAEEVPFVIRNVQHIVRLKDDLFAASASAVRWLMLRPPRRKLRANSDRKLKADARRKFVRQFAKERDWDGTLGELKKELGRFGIETSVSTLCRDLKGTRFVRNPSCAANVPGKKTNEREPVIGNEADDLSGVDAFTMPDDPNDPVS